VPHTDTLVFRTPDVVARDFSCDGVCGAVRPVEEATTGFEISVTLRGAWYRRGREGSHLADTTHVTLFNAGSPYVVEHPVPGGDRCLTLEFGRDALHGVAEDLGLRLGAGELLFRAPAAATTPRIQLLASSVLAEARGSADGETLGQDERCLDILGNVLRRVDPRSLRQARDEGGRGRDLVAAAQIALAKGFARKITLSALARQLGCSSFHLARTFKAVTGETLHARLIALRLSASLASLVESTDSISAIAHRFGFSDHSHFGSLFRRRYAMSPSEVRRAARRGQLPSARLARLR
jgi:AraC-like DNA-binding protein